jgi:anti-anti-sigma factor
MERTDELFEFRAEARIGVFRLLDRIGMFEAQRLRRAVHELVRDHRLAGLVFSFNGVPYIDSSGVGVFVHLHYQIGRSVPIRMCEIPDTVRDVLVYTNLISTFSIDESESESLRRLTRVS